MTNTGGTGVLNENLWVISDARSECEVKAATDKDEYERRIEQLEASNKNAQATA